MPVFVKSSVRKGRTVRAYSRDDGRTVFSSSKNKKDPYGRARGSYAKLEIKLKQAGSSQRISTLKKRLNAVSKHF